MYVKENVVNKLCYTNIINLLQLKNNLEKVGLRTLFVKLRT